MSKIIIAIILLRCIPVGFKRDEEGTERERERETAKTVESTFPR